jgi:hypothetical protein
MPILSVRSEIAQPMPMPSPDPEPDPEQGADGAGGHDCSPWFAASRLQIGLNLLGRLRDKAGVARTCRVLVRAGDIPADVGGGA